MKNNDWIDDARKDRAMYANEISHALDDDIAHELKNTYASINADAFSDTSTTWIYAIVSAVFAFAAYKVDDLALQVFPLILMLLRVCILLTRHTKVSSSVGTGNNMALMQLHRDRLRSD